MFVLIVGTVQSFASESASGGRACGGGSSDRLGALVDDVVAGREQLRQRRTSVAGRRSWPGSGHRGGGHRRRRGWRGVVDVDGEPAFAGVLGAAAPLHAVRPAAAQAARAGAVGAAAGGAAPACVGNGALPGVSVLWAL